MWLASAKERKAFAHNLDVYVVHVIPQSIVNNSSTVLRRIANALVLHLMLLAIGSHAVHFQTTTVNKCTYELSCQ